MSDVFLLLLCMFTLTVTGVTDELLHAHGYSRASTAFFCVCIAALNLFRVMIVPEFVINPAVLYVMLAVLLSALERGSFRVMRVLLCTLLVATIQVTFSTYIAGALSGLIMLFFATLFDSDALPQTICCAVFAPALAYVAATLIDVSGFARIDTLFNATQVLLAQLTGVVACVTVAYLSQLAERRMQKNMGES